MGADESTVKKKSIEGNNSDSFIWIFCPKCYSIPLIKPFLFNKQLFISIYCKCSYEEKQFYPLKAFNQLMKDHSSSNNFCKKHKSNPGYLYCISCDKWLCKTCYNYDKEKNKNHLYSKNPLRLIEYCHKHDTQQAVGYCYKCEKSVCEKCLEIQKKFRHDVFLFSDNAHVDKCTKKWNEFANIKVEMLNNNKKLKNDMIKLINDSEEITIEKKKLIEDKINDAYLKNENINEQICQFILNLFTNLNNSYHYGKIVNHNVFYNVLTNTKFDNSTFNIKKNSSNLIKHVAQLINYFNNIFLIKLNPLVNIKNIISERKNVTKQISKICILNEFEAATLNSKGVIIVWHCYNYNEKYRIKNVHITENNNENNEPINPNQILNNMDNDDLNIMNNMGANIIRRNNNNLNDNDDDDDEGMNVQQRANQRIIEQQFNILNVINRNNINNINMNRNNETRYIIKVFENHNNLKYNPQMNFMNNYYHEKDITYPNDYNIILNRNQINDDENEEDELDLNFTTMTFVEKYKLLILVIEKFSDIFLFNIEKRKTLNQKLIGHTKEVLEVLALKNNDLASYGADNTLRIWNMKNYQNVTIINIEIKKYYIYFTQLLYGNLIFATNESTTKILKLPMYKFLPDITEVNKPMNFFELPDKRLIISSEDYNVKIFKAPDYKEVIMLFKKRIRIYSFLLLDKNRLLLGFQNCSLNIFYYNIKSYNNYVSVAEHFSPVGSLAKIENDRVVSLSWDDMTKIFIVGS